MSYPGEIRRDDVVTDKHYAENCGITYVQVILTLVVVVSLMLILENMGLNPEILSIVPYMLLSAILAYILLIGSCFYSRRIHSNPEKT